ncbi:mobile mystery protein B [Marinoscillum furvescens]|uniref:Fic-DOC domain mobile mystery protein B n=1 Tax=Marinoscillum furvescens DSM 4134 TaxID=1122208 RepID=A0A3D9L0H3_MARFU|nr:mobile mystery protein B [Marinoscillum furvescens]RED96677.1 Fic-DOC domain mobile mystery protein B [Marinoscillum furvescens DSM 4134]
MGLNLEYIDGQTPLDEEEKEGLKIPTISTREELDEFEQHNIEESLQWLLTRKFKPEQILSEKFIRDLHKRMFGEVWKWAGQFRSTQKNIGVDYWQIPTQLKMLLDDAMLWYRDSVFEPDELAIRFKHRIVSIHCFPNGNGRHSRLMADVIIEKIYGQEVFSWGAGDLSSNSQARTNYLKAVKAADHNDFNLLFQFSRT